MSGLSLLHWVEPAATDSDIYTIGTKPPAPESNPNGAVGEYHLLVLTVTRDTVHLQ